jgi:predicted GH43/DUF377 family glycosyl hydrolase
MIIQRINGGKPVFEATNEWEKLGTSNSCALFLERNERNDAILEHILGKELMGCDGIKNGVVISLYTGNGRYGHNTRRRQYRGLAFFTPAMELVKKLDDPVLCPSDDPGQIDSVGVEDARLTWNENVFYAWYCGFDGKNGAACTAFSEDLIHWTKVAPLPGNINNTYNKDHVAFPERINGRWWMLHRPWGPKVPVINDMVIRLAFSDGLLGPWQDAGEIIRATLQPDKESTWAGAGPSPLSLGNKRFLLLYHTGCYFPDHYRRYDACAALPDFNRYSESKPESIVVKRIEPLMTPETEWEINKDLRIDIIFPMGCYVYHRDLIMVYGAGDKHTCAARIPFEELIRLLDNNHLDNNIRLKK